MKEKDKSLLEIAIGLLGRKQKPQRLNAIVREVMELKGLKGTTLKEATPQFILDFMQSGYFVYCGDDCWDLKERQSTTILDKDGHDYEDIYFDDEDVKKNELKDDIIYADPNLIDTEEEDEDDENEEDEDDLTSEFDDIASEFEEKDVNELDTIVYDEEEINEEDEEDK